MAQLTVPYRSPRPLRAIRPNNMVRQRLRLSGFGAVSPGEASQAATLAVAGGSVIAESAAAGSVVGPVGTAVGAAVGLIISILSSTSATTASHIGTWDSQLVGSLNAIPTAAGIGRQFQWNYDSQGLTQMIEACLATGIYMNWDPSLISSYDVCAHWAVTFATAVQTVCTAAAKSPAGGNVTVSISVSPGAGGYPNFNFTFKNPGIAIGPGAFAQNIIMGNSGLMYAMIRSLGETPAHAALNASNAAAQKVFALMADYVFAQIAPSAAATVTPPPPVAAVISSAAATAAAQVGAKAVSTPGASATPVATPMPTTFGPPYIQYIAANYGAVSSTPIVGYVGETQEQYNYINNPANAATKNTLWGQMIANQTIAAPTTSSTVCTIGTQATTSQSIDNCGNLVSTPVPVTQTTMGLTTTDWLLLLGGGAALFFLLRK